MNEEKRIRKDMPRLVKEVKDFGGGGAHVSIPKTLARPGDKVLIINLDSNRTRQKDEEEKDPDEIVEEKCCRCGHEWEGKRSEKPKQCPECDFAYWERPEGFRAPTWRNRGIRVTEQKVEKPPEEEE